MKGKFSLLLILATFLFSACSLEKAVIEPPVKKGFIEYREDAGVVTSKFPFAYTWMSPQLNNARYSKIFIAPVNTGLIEPSSWKKSIGFAIKGEEDFQKHIAKLGHYFEKTLKEAFAPAKENRFTLDESEPPTPGTARLEIAFTEVIFGKPVLYAGSFALPIPASTYMFDSVDSPMLSVEGKVTDAVTGELLATFADRKLPQVKPIDLNKFTTSSTLREVIDRWSDELFRSFNREGDAKVKSSSTFSLIPW